MDGDRDHASAAPVHARFAAAADHAPLCDLAPAAARELAAVVGGDAAFEDLPGWWQAALLEAEAGRRGAAAAPSSCCHARVSG